MTHGWLYRRPILSCQPQHVTSCYELCCPPPPVLSCSPSQVPSWRRHWRVVVPHSTWPVARPSSNSLAHVGDGCPLIDAWPVAVQSLDLSWTRLAWPSQVSQWLRRGRRRATHECLSGPMGHITIPSCRPQHVTSCDKLHCRPPVPSCSPSPWWVCQEQTKSRRARAGRTFLQLGHMHIFTLRTRKACRSPNTGREMH